jgi:hypothetical protein
MDQIQAKSTNMLFVLKSAILKANIVKNQNKYCKISFCKMKRQYPVVYTLILANNMLIFITVNL